MIPTELYKGYVLTQDPNGDWDVWEKDGYLVMYLLGSVEDARAFVDGISE